MGKRDRPRPVARWTSMTLTTDDPATPQGPACRSRALRARDVNRRIHGAPADARPRAPQIGATHREKRVPPALVSGHLISGRLVASGAAANSSRPAFADPAASACDATFPHSWWLRRTGSGKIRTGSGKIMPVPADSEMSAAAAAGVTLPSPSTSTAPGDLSRMQAQGAAQQRSIDMMAHLEREIETDEAAQFGEVTRSAQHERGSSPEHSTANPSFGVRRCRRGTPPSAGRVPLEPLPGVALLATIAQHREERFSSGRLSNSPYSPPRHSKTEWIDSFRHRPSSSAWSASSMEL